MVCVCAYVCVGVCEGVFRPFPKFPNGLKLQTEEKGKGKEKQSFVFNKNPGSLVFV